MTVAFNVVVVGMQWGDEGKGKIIDLLCPAFDAVVRFQGGNNAGHTVKFGSGEGDEHFALHLIPSGILQPGMACYLGNGMVIDPDAFLREVAQLEERGIETSGRLRLSDRAHALTSIHVALDHVREEARGAGRIGTTAKGIGPAYESKIGRTGIRLAELVAGGEEMLHRQIVRVADFERAAAEGAELDPDDDDDDFARWAERLSPYLCDLSVELNDLIRGGGSVLLEGAQGALLDVDHGTYPYVTSSNSTAGGAAVGSGIPPTAIDGAIGVVKAYTTRVGEGPMATELLDEVGRHLRDRGHEFGTTTGRPRRCGWLDLVVLRHAARVNGARCLALTKIDVLDELDELQVCVAYRIAGKVVRDLPAAIDRLAAAEPIYRAFPGWKQDTRGALDRGELPQAALDYIDFLEQELDASADLISSGPRREETVVSGGGRLEGWLGDRFSTVRAAVSE